jgi:hypothetical protein
MKQRQFEEIQGKVETMRGSKKKVGHLKKLVPALSGVF